MNTNPDLPENRPQDPATAANTAAPTASTERLDTPSASTTTTTTEPAPRRKIGKRTWIIGGAIAGVIVLGGAGFAIANEVNDSDALDDATRDRVASAALAYTGGGELIGAERDDDGYDAEVRLDDGSEVDLNLDGDFAVVSSDTDSPDGDDRSGGAAGDDDRDDDTSDQGSGSGSDSSPAPTPGTGDDVRVDDDTPLTAEETTSATEAALAETGQGEVVDVDRSDDRDHAFEVEVRLPDGSEVEVRLDADFRVVSTSPSD